jgi:hypothetical protein
MPSSWTGVDTSRRAKVALPPKTKLPTTIKELPSTTRTEFIGNVALPLITTDEEFERINGKSKNHFSYKSKIEDWNEE